MRRGLMLALMACLVRAQTPQTSVTATVSGARIEGRVLGEAGVPLRRAHITLRPLDSGLTGETAETDEKGNFELRNIGAGRYSLIVDRDGYLASSTFTAGGLRWPASFYITGGDHLSGVEFRLRSWAVLAGRVRMDDGELANAARVDLYREYHSRGRHAFAVAASVLTNDRGEYRIYGLQPGPYYLAATYARQPPAGYVEQTGVDSAGRELPATGMTTTFYPSTAKLTESVPVRLDYGQELEGMDLSLLRVRKVKIRGKVTSGVSGIALTNAGITLAVADDSRSATIATPARPSFDRDANFEIRDVAPGSYIVRVDATDAGMTLAGRAPLTVTSDDIDDLELLAAPARTWAGRIRVEEDKPLPANRAIRITLEPRSDTGAEVQASLRGSDFTADVARDEVYDVFADNLPGDFYVSAVRMGGSDVRAAGLPGSLASDTPFEVVLDARGGKLSGRVFGADGSVWSGANLMLIPEEPRRRLQDYRPGGADPYGQFQIRGIAPGRYALIAWLDAPPCDFYDPDAFGACLAAGMAVTIAQADDQNVILTIPGKP